MKPKLIVAIPLVIAAGCGPVQSNHTYEEGAQFKTQPARWVDYQKEKNTFRFGEKSEQKEKSGANEEYRPKIHYPRGKPSGCCVNSPERDGRVVGLIDP